MPPTRRTLLAAAALLPAPVLLGAPARAEDADPRMADRALGSPDAHVTVLEYFSLTCTHCADFSVHTFPRVKTELIDTGKIRYVFRDFPLDQVALTAAMVARSLKPEFYEPFVVSLLASQDRWAFARGVNSTDELWKRAALAGMPRDAFDRAIADGGLKNAILREQAEGEQKHQVNSTPTFVFNGRSAAGALTFDTFAARVAEAAGKA